MEDIAKNAEPVNLIVKNQEEPASRKGKRGERNANKNQGKKDSLSMKKL